MGVSSYILKSSKNNSFGTAFYVEKDDIGSFLITCAHVIESCGEENLIIKNGDETLSAKLIDIGSSDGIDLAVVYVEGLLINPIKLLFSTLEEKQGTVFSLNGFKLHKNDTYIERVLNGNIVKISTLHPESQSIKTYELKIENDYFIEKGYSGSAIIIDEKIIGVATDRANKGKMAYAIPIRYLEKVWKDIPRDFFKIKEEKQNIFNKIINDKKAPKEIREFGNKALEYFYMIKQYPKSSLIVILIGGLWYFKDLIVTEVKSFYENNNSIIGKSSAIENKKLNKIKIPLHGVVKNNNKNIYHLYREDDLDIQTTSEKNGSFTFNDILGKHRKNENIYIKCCKDKNSCREVPTLCKIGENCVIY